LTFAGLAMPRRLAAGAAARAREPSALSVAKGSAPLPDLTFVAARAGAADGAALSFGGRAPRRASPALWAPRVACFCRPGGGAAAVLSRPAFGRRLPPR
jgi:hypothetical protein